MAENLIQDIGLGDLDHHKCNQIFKVWFGGDIPADYCGYGDSDDSDDEEESLHLSEDDVVPKQQYVRHALKAVLKPELENLQHVPAALDSMTNMLNTSNIHNLETIWDDQYSAHHSEVSFKEALVNFCFVFCCSDKVGLWRTETHPIRISALALYWKYFTVICSWCWSDGDRQGFNTAELNALFNREWVSFVIGMSLPSARSSRSASPDVVPLQACVSDPGCVCYLLSTERGCELFRILINLYLGSSDGGDDTGMKIITGWLGTCLQCHQYVQSAMGIAETTPSDRETARHLGNVDISKYMFSHSSSTSLPTWLNLFVGHLVFSELVYPLGLMTVGLKTGESNTSQIPKQLLAKKQLALTLVENTLAVFPELLTVLPAVPDDLLKRCNALSVEKKEELDDYPDPDDNEEADEDRRIKKKTKTEATDSSLHVEILKLTSRDLVVSLLLKVLFIVQERKDYRDAFVEFSVFLQRLCLSVLPEDALINFTGRVLTSLCKLTRHQKSHIRILSLETSGAVLTCPTVLKTAFATRQVPPSFPSDKVMDSDTDVIVSLSGEEDILPPPAPLFFHCFHNVFMNIVSCCVDFQPTCRSRALEVVANVLQATAQELMKCQTNFIVQAFTEWVLMGMAELSSGATSGPTSIPAVDYKWCIPWSLLICIIEEMVLLRQEKSVVKRSTVVLLESLALLCWNMNSFLNDQPQSIDTYRKCTVDLLLVPKVDKVVSHLTADSFDQVRLRTTSMLAKLAEMVTDGEDTIIHLRNLLNVLVFDTQSSISDKALDSFGTFLDTHVNIVLGSLTESRLISRREGWSCIPDLRILSGLLLMDSESRDIFGKTLKKYSEQKPLQHYLNLSCQVLMLLNETAQPLDEWPSGVVAFANLCCRTFVPKLPKSFENKCQWMAEAMVKHTIDLVRKHNMRTLNKDGTLVDRRLTTVSVSELEAQFSVPPNSNFKDFSQLLIDVSSSLRNETKCSLHDSLISVAMTYEFPLWMVPDLMSVLFAVRNPSVPYSEYVNTWILFCRRRIFGVMSLIKGGKPQTYSPEQTGNEELHHMSSDAASKMSCIGFANALQIIAFLYYLAVPQCLASPADRVSRMFNRTAVPTVTTCFALLTEGALKDVISVEWLRHPPHLLKSVAINTLCCLFLSSDEMAHRKISSLMDVIKKTRFYPLSPVFDDTSTNWKDEALIVSHTVAATYDLALKTTALVDPYFLPLSMFFACHFRKSPDLDLNNAAAKLRLQAICILAQLAAQDFLKLKGPILYHFIYAMGDTNTYIRELAESIFNTVIKPRIVNIVVSSIVDCICFLNGYTVLSNNVATALAYSKTRSKTHSSTSETGSESPFILSDFPRRRGAIYAAILKNISESDKQRIVCLLVNTILEAFMFPIEGDEKLQPRIPISRSSTEGCVIGDTLKLLSCEELKIRFKNSRKPEESGGDPQKNKDDDEDEQAGYEQDLLKRNLRDYIMPRLKSMKKVLETKNSALQFDILECMAYLLIEHKNNLTEFINDTLLQNQISNILQSVTDTSRTIEEMMLREESALLMLANNEMNTSVLQ